MKCLAYLTSLGLLILSSTVEPHAHLQSATPADGSVINASPSSIVLSFSQAGRLTALWIQKDEEPEQSIRSFPTTEAQRISIPMPALAPGSYIVSWRIVSAHNHVMTGEIRFTLSRGGASNSSPPR